MSTTPVTCKDMDLTGSSPPRTPTGGLWPARSGNPQDMSEHVDWSAMSEEDFFALLRQLIENPEIDED